MKKKLFLILTGIALLSLLLGCAPAKEVIKEVPVVYEVVYPIGKSTAKIIPLAPRLDTLAGKTICELWNYDFQGDKTFPALRELLQKQYPTVKIIPYTELPNTYPKTADEEKALAALADTLVKKGCQAVISGNGG